MTPAQSLVLLGAGVLCFVAGLTWWLGPIALTVCGLLLAAGALLIPHPDPTPDEVAEAVRKALSQG